MSVESVTAQAWAAAEAIMTDACVITRPDPADYPAEMIVYSGKCRVKMFGRAASDQLETAGITSDQHRCRVDIPVSATGVQFNDHVTITSSLSPSMLPLDVFVDDISTVTFASAQRLLCHRSLR